MIEQLDKLHAADDLNGGEGRATFAFGFGWYSFERVEAQVLQTTQLQVHLIGLRRDPAIWTPAYATIYAVRARFHKISDPFEPTMDPVLPTGNPVYVANFKIAIEFKDSPETTFFIDGYMTGWHPATGDLFVTTSKVKEAYQLKDYDLLR